MDPIIWYIHGANSSPTSFAFHKSRMVDHNFVDVAYSSDTPVLQVIDSLLVSARRETRPIRIISHSLGGVIAVALSQQCSQIERIATMGAPFGGSRIASMLRWICPHQLLEDIHPQSSVVRSLQRRVSIPVLSMVTTKGHSILLTEPNDGVVTIASQMALTGPTYVSIPKNHFEVLLCSEASDLINGFIFE